MTARTSSRARSLGFRSMSEAAVAKTLADSETPFEYESTKLSYTDTSKHYYRPDFVLGNGVMLEVKGRFTATDRRKLLLVKQANPHADIRLVFDRPHAPLFAGAASTCAQWCGRHGFPWCGRSTIPKDWLT